MPGSQTLCFPPKQTIRLAIAISWAFSGAALLPGCSSNKVQAVYYKSEQQCIQAHRFSPETCARDWQQAQTIHQQSAPRYDDLDDCKKDVQEDRCEQVSSGGHTFYRPSMQGYIVDASRNQSSSNVITQPLYGNRRRGLFTAGGSEVMPENGEIVNVQRTAAMTKPAPASKSFAKGSITRGFGGSFHATSAGSKGSAGVGE